jgi:hypothetical protein
MLCRPDEPKFMNVLKLIGLTILNLLKEVWRVPHSLAEASQRRRRQTQRVQFEAERVDRIRHPWKYLGR